MSRSKRWPQAASTIISAAAFTATRWTATGTSRISRKCSTIRRNSSHRISIASRSPVGKAFADTARDILDYVRPRHDRPEGGFYSAEDADSSFGHGNLSKPKARSTFGRKGNRASARRGRAADIQSRLWRRSDGNAPREGDPHGEFRARTRSSGACRRGRREDFQEERGGNRIGASTPAAKKLFDASRETSALRTSTTKSSPRGTA